jgi:hypothetical protein
MKNLKVMMITLTMCLLTMVSFGQTTEMNVDKIFESGETKDVLYSKSKMFISEMFKSANDVIQLDDKENGVILVKGVIKESFNYSMQTLDYYFSFTMKIYVKDNKYRVVISDVYNSSAPYKYNKLLINNYRGAFNDNLPKSKYWELMESLSSSLNNFSLSFENYMKRVTLTNDGW